MRSNSYTGKRVYSGRSSFAGGSEELQTIIRILFFPLLLLYLELLLHIVRKESLIYLPIYLMFGIAAGLLLDAAGAGQEPQALYARFLEELDRALDVTAGTLDANDGEEELAPLALALALRSYADRLACQRLLELIRERRPESEKGKKTKSSRERTVE